MSSVTFLLTPATVKRRKPQLYDMIVIISSLHKRTVTIQGPFHISPVESKIIWVVHRLPPFAVLLLMFLLRFFDFRALGATLPLVCQMTFVFI